MTCLVCSFARDGRIMTGMSKTPAANKAKATKTASRTRPAAPTANSAKATKTTGMGLAKTPSAPKRKAAKA